MSESAEKAKILIIEDNPLDREIYRRLIARGAEHEFEILETDSGESGLELCRSEEPDCVLLDFNLPDLDGLEFLAELKGDEDRPSVPIIMLTGQGNESVAVEAMKRGAQDYLVKGRMDRHMLVRSIDHAIERHRLQQEVDRAREVERRMAHFDALTGLPNRQLFFDLLRQMTAQAKRNAQLVAVLFIDLDRFKNVNDLHGHAVGDSLLHLVAQRLTGCVRDSDTVARLGGDEFTMILGGVVQGEDAARVARKILGDMSRPFEIDDLELSISSSIGISLFPNDDSDVEALLKKADMAMYREKSEGKDNYQFYSSTMGARALELAIMENSLKNAMEKNELTIQYQPQVGAQTGEITGLEALLRWQHPELGLISPGKFIPLAEQSGLIVPIGEWVLHEVCAQIAEWRRAGIENLRVSINLSPRQFRDRDLAKKVTRVLEEASLSPKALGLEITESTTMRDAEYAVDTLRTLKDVGVQILLDDFGTGHSSLSYLSRFPIDFLKVDRSFVNAISDSAEGPAILSAIVSLAHNLNLEVIAEGVENESQLAHLRSLDCDEIQGFHFSRPLSVDATDAYLRREPADSEPVLTSMGITPNQTGNSRSDESSSFPRDP